MEELYSDTRTEFINSHEPLGLPYQQPEHFSKWNEWSESDFKQKLEQECLDRPTVFRQEDNTKVPDCYFFTELFFGFQWLAAPYIRI